MSLHTELNPEMEERLKKENAIEEIGEIADELDNLYHATMMPMPADFHLKQIKKSLPEKIKRLKKLYKKAGGKEYIGDEYEPNS